MMQNANGIRYRRSNVKLFFEASETTLAVNPDEFHLHIWPEWVMAPASRRPQSQAYRNRVRNKLEGNLVATSTAPSPGSRV